MRELNATEIQHVGGAAPTTSGSEPANPLALIFAIPVALIVGPLLIGALYNPGGGNYFQQWWEGLGILFNN